MTVLPLQDVRILAIEQYGAGPFGSLHLADLGADVIKIEDPSTGGDVGRYIGPYDGDEDSLFFQALNRNKRSLSLDLKHPAGKDAFSRVLSRYDVLFDQFRPGVLARLGLRHAELRAKHPRLVVCALTGYGQSGPLSQRAGHDLNYLARAGVLGMQGPEGGPPTVPGVQLADVSGGLYAVIGIMGALAERARTGEGSVVDVAMIETAMPFAVAGFGLGFGGHAVRGGAETLTGGIAPYQTYTTKDGAAMSLASLEPKFWMQFCAGIQRTPEMSDLVPGPHQAVLKDHLAKVFAEKTRDEWIAFAEERDCCLEPVLTPEEALRDPHLAARKMFFELASPWGAIRQMRTPLTSPDRSHTPPPKQGEHSTEILREAGCDDATIASLIAAGVVRTS